MNTRAGLLLLGLGILPGCGSDGTPPPSQAKAPSESAIAAASPRTSAGAITRRDDSSTSAKPAAPEINVIPEGNFTLMCQSFNGVGHERLARLAKETYTRATGRTGFFVFHDTDHSELLYGGYKSNDARVDPVEAQRAEADLKWLRSIKGPGDRPAFARSLLIPIPTADPAGNPEWNLANVDRDKPVTDPDRRYWSLVIAVYTSDVLDRDGRPGDRKQMAVDAVRQARDMGIPAFYYHGPSISHVCIGAWPRRAIAEQESSQASSKSESAANSNESLVVSSVPLPDAMTKDLESRSMKVVQPRLDIRDADLIATWRRYNEYAVNDVVQVNNVTDPATGEQKKQVQHSYLIEIPETQKQSVVTGELAAPGSDAPPPNLLNPAGPSTGGQLKGIGR